MAPEKQTSLESSDRHQISPLLELRDVAFAYSQTGRSGRPTLSNVSFAIGRGQALGLIGESGSGKSTIAKLALGLATPKEGAIYFDGRQLSKANLSAFRRRVQPIFQNPMDALDPRMTVQEQIIEPLLVNFRLPRVERGRRMAEALAAVGLPIQIAEKRPREISGGQAQRVTIARALVLNPDLLVCDEPVSALDMTVQAQILNLLSELKSKRHLSLLFISHDIRAVSHLCSEVVVLRSGRIVESGTRDNVLTQPGAEYTKLLLSSIPNFRPSRVGHVLADTRASTQSPSGEKGAVVR
ncbi:peptide/nickel transport system ATP-binding protein [Bradyrhizobium sp. USDA 326]|uniref:ABC transporter ATP-binding protein n=1 Tax=Bradyrhizobium sp. USDA 326 TaxID=3377726 RepID=UPI003C7209F4